MKSNNIDEIDARNLVGKMDAVAIGNMALKEANAQFFLG